MGSLFGSLIATQVTVSLLGFVFWAYAARSLPAHEVGLAAAAIAAMTLIATFAMLGVGTLLIAEIPKRPREALPALFGTGLLTVCGAGLIVGVAVGLIAPQFGSSLQLTSDLPLGFAAFVLGTVTTACGAVFDEGVLGLGRGPVQFLRNSFGSVARIAGLALMVVVAARTGEALLACWTISMVISLGVGFAALRLGRFGTWRASLTDRVSEIRANLRLAREHHALNVILQSSAYLLPVLAALIATPAGVAYFNSARLIAAAVLTIPFLLTIALFASTAADASQIGQRVRVTVPAGIALASACALVTVVIAPFVMEIFGGSYGNRGTIYLQLLVCAGPLLVVKDHFVAIRRIRGELRHAARWIAAGTILEMSTALGGGLLFGLRGLCIGWLVGLAVEALAMAPRVWSDMRRGQLSDHRGAGASGV